MTQALLQATTQAKAHARKANTLNGPLTSTGQISNSSSEEYIMDQADKNGPKRRVRRPSADRQIWRDSITLGKLRKMIELDGDVFPFIDEMQFLNNFDEQDASFYGSLTRRGGDREPLVRTASLTELSDKNIELALSRKYRSKGMNSMWLLCCSSQAGAGKNKKIKASSSCSKPAKK